MHLRHLCGEALARDSIDNVANATFLRRLKGVRPSHKTLHGNGRDAAQGDHPYRVRYALPISRRMT